MHATRTSLRAAFLPVGLIALSAIPVVAGTLRLVQLATGVGFLPDAGRVLGEPLPVVLHIAGASVFCVAGAFQFVSALRRAGSAWHRLSGRLLLPAGLAAALSGIWLTLFHELPPYDNSLLGAFRILAGGYMAIALVAGLGSIRRRDIGAHRAWMIHAYAIGLGAGTQSLFLLSWTLLVEAPAGNIRALIMASAWLANLAVAGHFIRKQQRNARP